MKPEDRTEAKLDQALEMTFPASDPFTVDIPEPQRDYKVAPAARDAAV
jgi:hypothetical protein